MKRSNLFRILLFAAILALLIPLLSHAVLGSYTRYIADDWCTAATVRSQGLMRAQYSWYMNWSGRYSFTFAVSLVELIGIVMVPILPASALVLWIAVTTWTVYQYRGRTIRAHAGLISLLIAELLIYAILERIPNVHQSLYWQTGMLTYIAPLILFTLMIGIFMYFVRYETNQHVKGAVPLLGILAFITGGFSEMYVAMQTTTFLIAIVVVLILKREDLKRVGTPMLVAGLVGSIVSLTIIFFAPGNEARQSLTPESPGILQIVGLSMLFAFKFVGKSVLFSSIPTALTLFIPALAIFTLHSSTTHSSEVQPPLNTRNLYSLLLLSPIVGYILIACSMAPSVYGVSAFPEDRALTIPQFVLSTTTIFWGFLVGLTLKSSSIWTKKLEGRITVVGCSIVVLLLILGPLVSSGEHFARAPILQAYAMRWDSRDREIRDSVEQGVKHLTIPALGFTGGLADIKDDPDYWVNRCFASYYGLETVKAEK